MSDSNLLVRRGGLWRPHATWGGSSGVTPPPPPPGPFTPRFAADPGPGRMFFGQSRSSGEVETRVAQFGTPVGMFRVYGTPGESVSSIIAKVRAQVEKGRLVWLSIKVPGDRWVDVATGAQDPWLRQLVSGIYALGGYVWIGLHHEPWDEAGVTGGAGNPVDNPRIAGNTAENWRLMQKRLKDTIAALGASSRMAVGPILQCAPFTPSTTGGNPKDVFSRWYSADSCDFIGLDSYNHAYWDAPPTAKQWAKWREPAICFGEGIGLARQAVPGHAVGIAEYGVRTDWTRPGRAGQWLKDSFTYLLGLGVVGMSYFDSDRNVNDQLASDPYVGADGQRYGSPWDLEMGGRVDNQIPETPANGFPGGPERVKAYVEILKDPRTAYLPAA